MHDWPKLGHEPLKFAIGGPVVARADDSITDNSEQEARHLDLKNFLFSIAERSEVLED